MPYADYSHYRDIYRGAMTAEEFDRTARRATAYLDRATADRIRRSDLTTDDAESIRDACCAVADAYLLIERGGGVASETNDGLSVSYAVGSPKSEGRRLYEAAALYLGGTGLLYRGVV